mgnify:CR=1 FL=1
MAWFRSRRATRKNERGAFGRRAGLPKAKRNKKKEGGGTSFLLSNGKIFDKVGVNKSTVSGIFPRQFRSKILGAESCNGWTYWHYNMNGSIVPIDNLRQKLISTN